MVLVVVDDDGGGDGDGIESGVSLHLFNSPLIHSSVLLLH